MSADRLTLDTNILFYASDNTAGEKQLVAQKLTRAAALRREILTLQSLAELSNAFAKRRLHQHDIADGIVRGYLNTFTVVPATDADLLEALRHHHQHNIPFWDAMLCATARRAGCTLLLSEDLQDGRTLDGFTIRNPFKLSPAELDQLIG